MKRKHLCVVASVIGLGLVGVTGCEKQGGGNGDVGATGPTDVTGSRESPGTAAGLTGSQSGTSVSSRLGSGVTNGASGNDTFRAVGAPGNTESGKGITTRPSSEVRQSQVDVLSTSPGPGGQIGGGGESAFSGNSGGALGSTAGSGGVSH